MKIYKISQSQNTGYDTYDSAIVAARNKEEARNLHPEGKSSRGDAVYNLWTSPENVKVELIGTTNLYNQPQVILASYNAG